MIFKNESVFIGRFPFQDAKYFLPVLREHYQILSFIFFLFNMQPLFSVEVGISDTSHTVDVRVTFEY